MGLLYFLSLRAKFGLYGVDIIPMSGFTFFACHPEDQFNDFMVIKHSIHANGVRLLIHLYFFMASFT